MTILSTKKLKPNQRELLLNAGVSFVEYNAIEIEPVQFTLPRKLENVIITSQNGARAILKNGVCSSAVENYFCVGKKTTAFLAKNGLKVTKTAQKGAELAHFIVENYKNKEFTYFCGNKRRDELPTIFKEANVSCNEIVVYETHPNTQSFDQDFDGILFFSPSGVLALAKANQLSTTLKVFSSTILSAQDVSSPRHSKKTVAICIGETTAKEARRYFETVVVSNATTVESTIAKAIKYLK